MSWEQQFKASMLQHVASHELVSKKELELAGSSYLGNQALKLTASAIGQTYTAKPLRHLRELVSVCASPIEEAMLYALCIVCHQHTENVFYRLGNRTFGSVDKFAPKCCIAPQSTIWNYRVDFLVTYIAGLEERRIVIECDGHEFHNRTREQAIRDRQMDRELQKLGLIVFRYTGSEIWSDVFECAEEAVATIAGEG